jgi:hypothetical protein
LAYSSPFHIIHYFGTEDLSEDPEFRRLQKKFMAEFNLPGNSFLTINRVEHSKDDILRIIDSLRELPFTSLHRSVFEHAETLHFFEEPKAPVRITEVMSFLDAMTTHADYSNLQELLLDALQENTKHNLSVHNYKAHRENSVLTNYLQEYQEIRLYETIRKQLFSLMYVLSSYHEKKIKATDVESKLSEDIGFLWTNDFIEFMNDLPEEFYEVEQALNESLLYFVIYCYNHYILSSAFHYRFIDAVLQLESLDRYTRNQLYDYRDRISDAEEQERRQLKEIVREPDKGHIYLAPADKKEMSGERKAKLQKRLDREFMEVRIVKAMAVIMGACAVLGGVLAPLTKLSLGLLMTALALLFILILFWIKTFFKKTNS